MHTVRAEHTDRILTYDRHHATQILVEYAQHYNSHRSHQDRDQCAPNDDHSPIAIAVDRPIRRHQVLGGVINEYYPAA